VQNGSTYSRLLKPPEGKSFFLFGPWGTGKTTWVKSEFPGALYLDLLEAELFNDLLANPQRLERLIPKGYRDWIVIDGGRRELNEAGIRVLPVETALKELPDLLN
jgi:hypothetical protein